MISLGLIHKTLGHEGWIHRIDIAEEGLAEPTNRSRRIPIPAHSSPYGGTNLQKWAIGEPGGPAPVCTRDQEEARRSHLRS